MKVAFLLCVFYLSLLSVTYATTVAPTVLPSSRPSCQPSKQPSKQPSNQPSSQPSTRPSSAPSITEESWGETTWDMKRTRSGGLCENGCSGNGICKINANCDCYVGLDGEKAWTGADCSLRTCPKDMAWVADVVNANDLHGSVECSNRGICDRKTGTCQCQTGYDGIACQRTVCPNNCNDKGTCWPEKHLANKAGRLYTTAWDALKHVGCYCDKGYRGPDCSQQECPSGTDPLHGYGNEAGRECSGRGSCDYTSGTCQCYTAFFGTKCQFQSTVQ